VSAADSSDHYFRSKLKNSSVVPKTTDRPGAGCTGTMRSKIGPMKRVARMLRGHQPLILNWFRAKGRVSNGVVEGFNAKATLTTRNAHGLVLLN
jgi:transposase